MENLRRKNYKYHLEERLINFAVMIMKVVEKLPNTYAGKHYGNQLLRSGSSPALNYGEAQAAESTADFIHKMRICLKELRESQICLKRILRKPLLPKGYGIATLKECSELVAIFTKSTETTKENNRK